MEALKPGQMYIVVRNEDGRLYGSSYDTEVGADNCTTYIIDYVPPEELEDMDTLKYIDGKLFRDLEYAWQLAKDRKATELDFLLIQAIESGFNFEVNGTVYRFSYDSEAQSSIASAERLLDKGLLKTVNLTGYLDGVAKRVPFTKELMDDFSVMIYMHKEEQYARLGELLELLDQSKTVEDVKAIQW